MKYFSILLTCLLFFSCQSEDILYSEIIIDNGIVNTDFLRTVDEAEKALISGYLFAYGNECNEGSTKIKCKILEDLKIDNECDYSHIDFLNQWFKNDVIMIYKLKKCPNISHDSAIQNEIKYMDLYRHNDTLKISILVYGLNNSQEKSWNSNQTESFLIDNNTFKKLY